MSVPCHAGKGSHSSCFTESPRDLLGTAHIPVRSASTSDEDMVSLGFEKDTDDTAIKGDGSVFGGDAHEFLLVEIPPVEVSTLTAEIHASVGHLYNCERLA